MSEDEDFVGYTHEYINLKKKHILPNGDKVDKVRISEEENALIFQVSDDGIEWITVYICGDI